MAKKFLNGPNIEIGFEQMAGIAVAKGVSRGSFCQLGNGLFDSFLNMGFVKMVTPDFAASINKSQGFCRKKPLPSKLLSRMFILLFDLMKHKRPIIISKKILLVQIIDLVDLGF